MEKPKNFQQLVPMIPPNRKCLEKRETNTNNVLYNMDCLDGMRAIPKQSIGMVLCDLPYGVTDYEWDIPIQPEALFSEWRRICRQNANVVLFCQQPFTATLLNASRKSEFSHSLIWVKNTKTRQLSGKKVPMSQYEEIMVFRVNKYGNKNEHHELRKYFLSELEKSGMSVREMEYAIKNRGAHHFFRGSSDFRIPTLETYTKMQKTTGLFGRPYAEIRREFDTAKKSGCTYNAPKENTNVIYCKSVQPRVRLHNTQKPLELCERLVETYSNTGDTVLDCCAGSNTTGIACLNIGRKYIGFEKDSSIYNVAISRTVTHEETLEAARQYQPQTHVPIEDDCSRSST